MAIITKPNYVVQVALFASKLSGRGGICYSRDLKTRSRVRSHEGSETGKTAGVREALTLSPSGSSSLLTSYNHQFGPPKQRTTD